MNNLFSDTTTELTAELQQNIQNGLANMCIDDDVDIFVSESEAAFVVKNDDTEEVLFKIEK